jgi:hypothetical protein
VGGAATRGQDGVRASQYEEVGFKRDDYTYLFNQENTRPARRCGIVSGPLRSGAGACVDRAGSSATPHPIRSVKGAHGLIFAHARCG